MARTPLRGGAGRIPDKVSIIGADAFTGGYGAAKIAHEQAMVSGPVPVRVVRASQFHEFVPQMMEWGTQGGVTYVPRMRTQLVAGRTVGEILAELVADPSAFAAAPTEPPYLEVAGPRRGEPRGGRDASGGAAGSGSRIEPGHNPNDPDADVYESGALLPGPGATLAGPTFEEWLTSDQAASAGVASAKTG